MTACNKTAVKDKELVLSQSRAIRSQYHNNTTFVINNGHNQTGVVYTNRLELGPLVCIDKILLHIYQNIVSADDFLLLRLLDYPIVFAKNQNEFRFFLDKTVELGYLEREGFKFRLTLEGWKYVNELRKTMVLSNQAFVAMWFTEEMKEAYFKGFKPALEATDYNPIRIDLFPHNKKIDDEIIAKIRQSGLLIADFTGNRSGVYFEAGFAMGLGMPLIWTCRQDYISELHFDTRQYNHIVWENSEDLKDQLIYRIEATIPKHKIASSELG